jgi:hypothetical protein
MDAFGQWLIDGDIEAAVHLLRDAARTVRLTRFPPGDAHSSWDDGAIDDLVANFVVKKGVAGTLEVLGQLHTRGSAFAFIRTSLERFLIDEAKATTHGKLRNRLETIFSRDGRFTMITIPPKGWRLPDGADDWWGGGIRELIEVALRVRGYQIESLPTAGPTPGADAEALAVVSLAVLGHAACIVRAEDLSRVLVHRFQLGENTPIFPTEPVGSFEQEAATAVGGKPTDSLPALAARQIYAKLSEEHRRVLVAISEGADVATALGVGAREAAVIEAQVRELVCLATADDDEVEQVIAELLDLCRTDAPP